MIRRALALLVVGGCVAVDAPVPLPSGGGVAAFAELAQPVLAARCANPSCHGNAERALSLYAVHRFRAVESDRFIDAPLSDEELAHNWIHAAAFVVDAGRAEDAMLLTKPLGRHAGTQVFADATAYEYRQLQAWVTRALVPEDP